MVHPHPQAECSLKRLTLPGDPRDGCQIRIARRTGPGRRVTAAAESIEALPDNLRAAAIGNGRDTRQMI